MARPEKTGLDYFPMDVTIDDNLELVEAEHGVAGFGIVVKLWQKIYSQGYFIRWDDDTTLLFSRKINTDLTQIKSVVNSCFLRNIFSEPLYKKHGILTSGGIQKRYVTACNQSKRKSITLIKEYNLLTPELTKLITEETELNPEESTQRKGKERKEDINKGEKETLSPRLIVDYYNEHRRSMPEVVALNSNRKKTITARTKEYGEEVVIDTIKKATASDFLNGKNEKDWTASFDFIMGPKNFVKVMEGNYDNRKKKETVRVGQIRNFE